MIKRHVQEQHTDAPDFSLFRLSAGLKKRGFNFKRTRLSLKKRDEPAFLAAKNTLEIMKNAAKAGKAQLFFQDEAGMSNLPNVQRAWSLIGGLTERRADFYHHGH
jgi:hypothetical protein